MRIKCDHTVLIIDVGPETKLNTVFLHVINLKSLCNVEQEGLDRMLLFEQIIYKQSFLYSFHFALFTLMHTCISY
jgi:hypothetical protein